MNAYMTFIKSSTIFGFNIFHSYQLENEKSQRPNLELKRKKPTLIKSLVYIPELERDTAT